MDSTASGKAPARSRLDIRQVAFLGTYLPRQCGIATFTADVCDALMRVQPELQCSAIAVNDVTAGYEYPARVRFEVGQDDELAYHRAATFLELSDLDLLCVQHEFGIFGGEAGAYVLDLLREVSVPVVTTLHTVLRSPPTPAYGAIFEELLRLSDRLVVISQKAVDLLQELHGVDRDRIDLIPHGVHDVPFVDPNFYKDQFDVTGRQVILTFGLLGPNKGIEYVLDALPQIVERHPEVVYLVLGATHPYWLRKQGEAHREALQRRAETLGIADHVHFHNRFVRLDELLEYLGAAEIYITPYLDREQISSGTLAYAAGCGKAIVSTPYWYAEELLAEGRGQLVPFRSSDGIARAVNALLDHPTELHAMRKRAYLYSRQMVWSRVARQYLRSFQRAREERLRGPRQGARLATVERPSVEPPALDLRHLRRLTDDVGIFKHATFTVPRREDGYCTDDNARALVLCTLLHTGAPRGVRGIARRLGAVYLAFLEHAYDPEAGRFRNLLGFDRHWIDRVGSEDCHGRALWALGAVAGRFADPGMRDAAAQLFARALPATVEMRSPRAWAFTLIGIHEYLRRFYGDHQAEGVRRQLARRLLEQYRACAEDGWAWFEDEVTYANARLPQALLLAGRWLPDGEMVESGLRALGWLAENQRGDEGVFSPVGCLGYFRRSVHRARFDQLPIEAHGMVAACLEAHRISADPHWLREAQRAFHWFTGGNDLRVSLYDETSGGCRDALHPERAAPNQSAEATLSFLISLVELEGVRQQHEGVARRRKQAAAR